MGGRARMPQRVGKSHAPPGTGRPCQTARVSRAGYGPCDQFRLTGLAPVGPRRHCHLNLRGMQLGRRTDNVDVTMPLRLLQNQRADATPCTMMVVSTKIKAAAESLDQAWHQVSDIRVWQRTSSTGLFFKYNKIAHIN
jgi:hypothetical protein